MSVSSEGGIRDVYCSECWGVGWRFVCVCLTLVLAYGVSACAVRMLMTESLALAPEHYTHVHANRSIQAP